MATPRPGDLIFCHSKGGVGWAIRLGERLRFRSGDFYNHVAIVQSSLPNGDWAVIQAEAHGVTAGAPLSTVAPGGSYEIVSVPGTTGALTLQFAQSQVGKSYGWASIASIAIKILLPKHFPFPSFRSDRTWICSAIGGESARFGGWLHDWPDVYSVVPSELYAAIAGIGVRDVRERMLTKMSKNERGPWQR